MEPVQARSYTVDARSTDTFGRVLCHARTHHFIIDGPPHNGCPGEELTPAESFLAGVAACGVELVEAIAREDRIPLKSARVEIVGTIDRSNPVRSDLTVFNQVTLRVQLSGVPQNVGQDLVDRFKRRCPLFGSVAVATPDVIVVVECAP